MKRLSVRLMVALLTFTFGVGLAAFFTLRARFAQLAKREAACIPTYDSNFSTLDESETFLKRFEEVALQKLPSCVDESYRVIWIPTLHFPIAVRIWTSSRKRYLVSKQLSGKGGYGMDSLSVETTRPLTENEWLIFTRLLDESAFWNTPSEDTAPPPNDGADWIIEGVKAQQYHNVRRRSPSVEFRASCVYLIKLTGLQTEIDKY